MQQGKIIFLLDSEMNPECLCFASGLMSSLAIKIVQSEEEPNVKSIELEIYMSAQKIEGVSVASAIRRLFTGSISSRLGDFIASMSKIQSLPLHPNSPQRLGKSKLSNHDTIYCA